MKNILKISSLILILVSCSKPISIDDLEGEEGLAIDPKSGAPYSGEAYLNYYNGEKRMVGNYEEGIKTGDWVYYLQDNEDKYYNLNFKNGNIVAANYNEGKRQWVGTPVTHNPDSLMADGHYFVQEVEVYNYNMSPKVYVQMINSIPHGNLTRWWENGEIYSDGSFENGNRNGQFTWWYKSGAKKETSFWQNAKQVGKTTQWYENGKKFAEANYEKGILTGKLVWWYEDGQKKEEVNFIEGERDGFAYWWYPNGNKKGVADISSGMGLITMFSNDGSFFNRFEVKKNQIFCNSGEMLFSIENVSNSSDLPLGDGTCDCADCSDEKK